MAPMRGAVKDGKVEAYDLKLACPSVTASWLAGCASQPSARHRHCRGCLGLAVPDSALSRHRLSRDGWCRSAHGARRASGNGFLPDCFLDELIRAAGADPLKELIRLRLHEPSRRVLERGRDAGQRSGKDRGRGIAFTLSFGVPVAEWRLPTHGAASRSTGCSSRPMSAKCSTPQNFENQVQGGVILDLGHAINLDLTYRMAAGAEELRCLRNLASLPDAGNRGTRDRQMQLHPRHRGASGSARRARARRCHLRRHWQTHPRIAAE